MLKYADSDRTGEMIEKIVMASHFPIRFFSLPKEATWGSLIDLGVGNLSLSHEEREQL